MAVQVCALSMWEREARRSEIQGHPQLHNKLRPAWATGHPVPLKSIKEQESVAFLTGMHEAILSTI